MSRDRHRNVCVSGGSEDEPNEPLRILPPIIPPKLPQGYRPHFDDLKEYVEHHIASGRVNDLSHSMWPRYWHDVEDANQEAWIRFLDRCSSGLVDHMQQYTRDRLFDAVLRRTTTSFVYKLVASNMRGMLRRAENQRRQHSVELELKVNHRDISAEFLVAIKHLFETVSKMVSPDMWAAWELHFKGFAFIEIAELRGITRHVASRYVWYTQGFIDRYISDFFNFGDA